MKKNSIVCIKDFPYNNDYCYAFVTGVYTNSISLIYFRDNYYVESYFSINFFRDITIIKENSLLDDLKDINSSLIFK